MKFNVEWSFFLAKFLPFWRLAITTANKMKSRFGVGFVFFQ